MMEGWIKNKSNGDVEAVVSGKKEGVNIFIEWCKEGPEKAVVDEVKILHIEETIFKEFKVER